MTSAVVGVGLMTAGCCTVMAVAVIRAWTLDGELSPWWTRVYRWGRRMLPMVAAVILLGGVLADDLSSVMGASAALLLWWMTGGGDGLRRLVEWATGVVTRSGNRLAVTESRS